MAYTYEYPRPSVTVDALVLALKPLPAVLLIQRKFGPDQGKWALPGGFVDMDEDLYTAALRELKEETTLENVMLEQMGTYGAVDRDPRGRTISIVYTGVIEEPVAVVAQDDAALAKWFDLDSLPVLAFDHAHILADFKKKFQL